MLLAFKIGSFTVKLENLAHFKMEKNDILQKELFEIIKESKTEINMLSIGEEALVIGKNIYGIWIVKDKKRIIIKDIISII